MAEETCVMIVDDEEINREMLRYILSPYVSSLLVAANGEEALLLLAQNRQVDVILLDLEMPILNGLQTTLQIRASEQIQGGHIPIIAMTASELPEDSERCHQAGMDAFISKPFNIGDILSVMERVTVASPALSTPLIKIEAAGGEQHHQPEALPETVFNYAGLLTRVGNRKDLINDYVEMFTEEIDVDLPALERAIVEGDSAAIARLTHSIKGTTCNIGAERMCAIGGELAQSARSGTPTDLRPLLASLQVEYQRFKSVREQSALL